MPHLEAVTIHSRRPSELAPFWSALLDLPIDPADAAAIERDTLGASESVLLGRRDALHVWVSPAEELAPVGRPGAPRRAAGRTGRPRPARRPRCRPPLGRSARTLAGVRRPRGQRVLRRHRLDCRTAVHLTEDASSPRTGESPKPAVAVRRHSS